MRRDVFIGLAVFAAAVAVAAGLLATRVDDERGTPPAVQTRGQAVAIGGDGRAVALVERFQAGTWRTALVRERDREPFATVPVEGPAALAVQRDGHLLVAGTRVERGRRLLAVARVAPDGVLDERFGAGGVAALAAGTGDAVPRGIAIGAGGIVVTADAHQGAGGVVAAATLTDTGAPVRTELIPDATSAGVAADGRDGVLVAGTRGRDGTLMVARLAIGGTLDAGYGAGGVAQIPAELASPTWSAIAATPDGGAVVVGSGRDAQRRSLIAAIVLGPRGEPGRRFSTAAGDGDAFGSGAAVDRYGQIVAAGTASQAGRPFAVSVGLGSDGAPAPAPVRRAPGRLAGIARDVVLTTFWDGRKTSTNLAR